MRTRFSVMGLVGFVLIGASSIQADLIHPDGISRYVSVQSGGPQVWQFGTGVDPFSAALTSANGYASATHNSTITADSILLTGSASAYGDSELPGFGGASLEEWFTLTSGTPYRFSMDWSMSADAGSQVSSYLVGPSGDIFRSLRNTGNGTWSIEGFLSPGQYRYGIDGGSAVFLTNGSAYPSISFSATFSLLPEPTSLALLGLGVLPLLRRRRLAL